MALAKPARILIIAGSDSGGGAGIQADIKTVTMMGGHAMTAVTAITAQNSMGVDAVHIIPTDIVLSQIEAVVSDFGVDAVKIGMIGNAQTANAVADYLADMDVPIVFDPVMVATSGAVLADSDTINAFAKLMAIATVATPNAPELAALGGRDAILGLGCSLLIKGGHVPGGTIMDQLWSPTGLVCEFKAKRLVSNHTHGTGCTLASAIACRLGQGFGTETAFLDGVRFVRSAILHAPGLGAGHGPLGQQDVTGFWHRGETIQRASFNQVTLGVHDYEAAKRFYEALGLLQIVDSPTNGYGRFEASNGVTLSIHAEEKKNPETVIYLESSALDAWVDELVMQGMTFDQMPVDEDWLWREARLRDPSGNIVCLYHAGENRRFPPWRNFE